jgi:hypothetical protein
MPLCPPQTPHAARMRTRTAAVGSQRLTAWATARPWKELVARVLSWKSGYEEKTLCVIFLDCVIQRDCYSSCVKICCQEMARGDCNRLRTLVCVCKWSVKCGHELWVYKWSINWVTNPNPTKTHGSIVQNILGDIRSSEWLIPKRLGRWWGLSFGDWINLWVQSAQSDNSCRTSTFMIVFYLFTVC